MRVFIGVCLDAKPALCLSLTVTLPPYVVRPLGVIEFRVPTTFALVETERGMCLHRLPHPT